eukprot:TRINITY_DN6072_c0_g1_i1.p1 TRINITY_DN6072_c0_g1~~TRINITY_DN6072_c0_g1_i1.p1  ORF type:complete len:298 (-),score=39.23 TRINITY_DN6072_c0_g1_i1:95-928(-)
MEVTSSSNFAVGSTEELSLQLESLPEECLLSILSFLDVLGLCRMCQCSSRWNTLSCDDSIWIPICRERWADKQNKDLTSLRFEQLQNTLLGFKCWYRHEEIDAKRTEINMDDLVSNVWSFRFHYGGNYAQFPTFTSEYKLYMEGRSMRWRFTDDNKIQVEQYPPLSATRLSNWGWKLQNNFVNFTTQWKDRSEAPKPAKKEPAADRREAQMNFLVPLYNMIVMALGNQEGEDEDEDFVLPGLNDDSDDEEGDNNNNDNGGSDNDDDEKDTDSDDDEN